VKPVGRIQLLRSRLVAASAIALFGALVTAAAPLVAAPAPAPTRPILLSHIGLTTTDQAATLTLSLTAPIAPHLAQLHSPERLVIDLPGTRQAASLPSAPPGSMVTALRAGVRGKHALRLVLEFKSAPASAPRVTLIRHSGAQRELRIEIGAPLSARAVKRAPAPLRDIRAAHAPSGQREVIVAVDAGHGGVDPGATGPDGTHEKGVTLAIAQALAARINREPGMHAVLTRDGDYFVALRDRMERARAAHADLFVSIHADSVRDPDVSGASVYILSERGASSEAARRLADEENSADLKGGISLATQAPDLRSVLMNLSQSASIGESGEAAQDVLRALDEVGAIRKREVQQAAFVVLKSPDVPSMLVETAYISNRTDEARLSSVAQQRRLAQAIFSGIADYFRQYPPEGSLFAHAHAVASSASS